MFFHPFFHSVLWDGFLFLSFIVLTAPRIGGEMCRKKSIFVRIFALAHVCGHPTTRPGFSGTSSWPQTVEGLDRRLDWSGLRWSWDLVGRGGRGCVLSLLQAKIHDAYLIPAADPITHWLKGQRRRVKLWQAERAQVRIQAEQTQRLTPIWGRPSLPDGCGGFCGEGQTPHPPAPLHPTRPKPTAVATAVACIIISFQQPCVCLW